MAKVKGRVFPLDPRHTYPVLVRGEGSYVYDSSMKKYLDAASGISVANIGYGRCELAEIAAQQMNELPYCAPNIFTNRPAQELSQKLARLTPGDLNCFQFTSGGSESVEVALKFARQYHVERGESSRYLFISRWVSYHGATLGALSITGHAGRRRKFLPLLKDNILVPPAYCYRCPMDKEYPACDIDCARSLETTIRRYGAENIAGFIVEPIVGSTAGGLVPPPEYLPLVRDICSKYGVLLIADEVMTGIGRTGANFGVDHWNVVPDIMALAKGIAGGYACLGAVAVRESLYEIFERNIVAFDHVLTYGANPLSTRIGAAVLDIIVRENLIERVRTIGKYLLTRLEELRRHEIVGDIRGKGLLLGIELVADRKTKECFDRDQRVSGRLADIALSKGLVVYPGSGAVDGERGDHICIYPTFIITGQEIDELVSILDESLDELGKQV